MGREDDTATAAEDDARVHAQLNALSTLTFTVTPGHKAADKARRLDDELRPIRERAKAALAEGRPTREALADCWALVGRAGAVIDAAGWWLDRNNSTRAWAERHVERGVRAVERRQAWQRWARGGR